MRLHYFFNLLKTRTVPSKPWLKPPHSIYSKDTHFEIDSAPFYIYDLTAFGHTVIFYCCGIKRVYVLGIVKHACWSFRFKKPYLYFYLQFFFTFTHSPPITTKVQYANSLDPDETLGKIGVSSEFKLFNTQTIFSQTMGDIESL